MCSFSAPQAHKKIEKRKKKENIGAAGVELQRGIRKGV